MSPRYCDDLGHSIPITPASPHAQHTNGRSNDASQFNMTIKGWHPTLPPVTAVTFTVHCTYRFQASCQHSSPQESQQCQGGSMFVPASLSTSSLATSPCTRRNHRSCNGTAQYVFQILLHPEDQGDSESLPAVQEYPNIVRGARRLPHRKPWR